MKIHGYFQSERYFRHHKEKIIALFEPKDEIVDYILERYGNLLAHPTTVSIHVRTYGRYDPNHQDHPSSKDFYFYGRDYVEKAISFFPQDAMFIVFSDDTNWCKENLKDLSQNMHFIEGEKYYHDFYFMSLCDHNIISNSTFSWWAAYLNKNPNKTIVTPKKLLSDLHTINEYDRIPEEWITIE